MAKLRKNTPPLSETNPELLSEWDYDKNTPLTPDRVTCGSHKKVWWRCPQGHEWDTAIKNRAINGSDCPYCSGLKVLSGFNDLQTVNPELVKEWDYEKNYPVTPDIVSSHTHKKAWWKCENGHFWEAEIKSRVYGSSCPYCAGKKVLCCYNDLQTVNPELAKEWDCDKNAPKKPNEVTAWSHEKYWWRCYNGHSWNASVAHRSRGEGCPYCSGNLVLTGVSDLLTVNPELAKEWDYEKNYPLTPKDISSGAHHKIWWKCDKGHSWCAAMNQRTRGRGCPYCSNKKVLIGYNDLQTTHPDIAKEWNYEKNGELKPTDFTYSASIKVWWKCKFGHEWCTTLNSRAQGSGCPDCARAGSSMPEQGVAFYLSKVTKVETRIKLYGKEVDIYLPDYAIGIEYDGIYWHKDRAISDIEKDNVLAQNGIKVLRLVESDKESVENNKIYFIYSDSYSNYSRAVKQLCDLLSSITDNADFKNLEINYINDRALIRERFDLYEKNNSFAVKYPELSKEWNYEKNGILTPEMFYSSARDKVWWKCKNNHEWKSSIVNRTRTRGCPYCFAVSLSKPVLCIETNIVYKSGADALRQTGIKHISSCCTGKRKTAGGYHWKYITQ